MSRREKSPSMPRKSNGRTTAGRARIAVNTWTEGTGRSQSSIPRGWRFHPLTVQPGTNGHQAGFERQLKELTRLRVAWKYTDPMPMIIKSIQRMAIPLATRLENDRKRIIIIGGTKKKKTLDTWRKRFDMNISCINQIHQHTQTWVFSPSTRHLLGGKKRSPMNISWLTSKQEKSDQHAFTQVGENK